MMRTAGERGRIEEQDGEHRKDPEKRRKRRIWKRGNEELVEGSKGAGGVIEVRRVREEQRRD